LTDEEQFEEDWEGIVAMPLVTRELIAEKLGVYLRHDLSLAALVDWAESAVMEKEFDPALAPSGDDLPLRRDLGAFAYTRALLAAVSFAWLGSETCSIPSKLEWNCGHRHHLPEQDASAQLQRKHKAL